MKQITLLLLLFFSLTISAQDKSDWKSRTKFAYSYPLTMAKSQQKSPAETYAHYKVEAIIGDKLNITKPVMKLTDQQISNLSKVFIDQYPLFVVAYDKYKESETIQNKIDLIKLLLSFEDDFRKHLNEDQLIVYKSYDPNKDYNSLFLKYFMTEKTYYSYKKELL